MSSSFSLLPFIHDNGAVRFIHSSLNSLGARHGAMGGGYSEREMTSPTAGTMRKEPALWGQLRGVVKRERTWGR